MTKMAREYARQYYAANRERLLQRARDYYHTVVRPKRIAAKKPKVVVSREERRQRSTEQMRAWRKRHPGYFAAWMREHRRQHPDRVREIEKRRYAKPERKTYIKALYAKHRERIIQQNREKYRTDPVRAARAKAWARQWQQANPERKKELRLRWQRAHPERVRAISAASAARYRARKYKGGPLPMLQDVLALNESQGGRCFYCAAPLVTFHLEHKIPLARGGTNDLDNLCLSCPTCNHRKGQKTAEEFLALVNR